MPPTAPELIYTNSEVGFALISQRNESVQRMYFQCDPEANLDDWSDAAIFDHIQQVLGGPDVVNLKRGPLIEKTVQVSTAPLEQYSRTALDRVWKAQNFSCWATNLLHRQPDENEFAQRRRRG